MKNNWIKTVASINKEKYTIPHGWDTKEQVAIDLQCSPDRVCDLLKHGIQSGIIERQDFPVWDDNRRLTTRITCYRILTDPPPKPKSSKSNPLHNKIIRSIKRNPSAPDHAIAKNTRSQVAVVKAVRASIS